jgi:sulfatase maturation enzyme AslB (radical SAM superfamily)
MKNGINIGVNLTRRCDMKCTWCYYEELLYVGNKNSSIPYNPCHDASLEMLKNKLQDISIKNIYITGGEPMTYPFLKEFLDWVKEKVNDSVFVCTNAKLIDDNWINYFSKNDIKLLISIKDNSKRTFELFNKFNDHGIKMHIYHVLTKKSIPILKDFVEKFGWIERVRLLYETSSNPEKNVIDYENWFGLLNIAYYYLRPIVKKIEVEIGFLPSEHPISQSKDRGAVKRFILDFDGRVYPCPLLVEKNNGVEQVKNEVKCTLQECPVLCNSKSSNGFTPICPFIIANLEDLIKYSNSLEIA